MLKTQSINPVARAVLVVGAVTALATGVTFAALQSEATLSQNTISASGALQINNNPEDETFSQSEAGFAFVGIVPGVTSSESHEFELRNVSNAAVDVNVHIPTAVALPEGVTAEQIKLTFTPVQDGTAPMTTPEDPSEPEEPAQAITATWAELAAADGKLLATAMAANTTAKWSVKVDITGDVPSVTIPGFDLLFGVPGETTPEEPEEPTDPTQPEEPVIPEEPGQEEGQAL